MRNPFKTPVPESPEADLPKKFAGFLLYVYRKNPCLWPLFFLQDVVHFTRYPLSFILLGKIIDTLGKSTPADGIPHHVIVLLGVILGILIIGEGAHIWTASLIVHWKPALRKTIRSDFLAYTMGHSHAYFQDHFAGSLSRKISEVAESALRLHDIVRFQIWFAIIQMVTSFIFLISVSWIYGAFLLVFIASITLPVLLSLPKIRYRSLNYSEQRAHVTGVIVDMLSNIPAMKSFSALAHERDVHAVNSNEEQRRFVKLIRSMVQIENLRRVSLICLGAGMTTLVVYGWSKEWLTVGQASSIATLSMMLTGTTWMLSGGIVQFVDEAGYITDALNITTRPHGVTDKPHAPALSFQRGEVTFSNVEFSFPGKPVFDRLSVTIAPGEKVALVGPSGAGKTTFVTLLLRLYDLNAGSISIDAQNIADVTQHSLRQAISVIPQDTTLFHRTLMENIRYGRLDASDEDVYEAARKAHAHEFIETLSHGYHTMVGERGVRLSGGQRQRIAIARAILKDAPVLILDEATSALDSESERLIQNALAELMRDKTVIAIAHRLSTIAHMDRILVFENGVIAEQGRHSDLIGNGPGLYARLWAMQSGGFIVSDNHHKGAII